MGRYSAIERVGVNAVEALILKEIQWIFREQPIADFGIDAHLESVIEGDPTGKLLGVQLKTGSSHFTIKDSELVYYGDLIHLNYWLSNSLPVIIVAHLPDSGETYWAHVNGHSAIKTGKAWKISIPKDQLLNQSAVEALSKILEGGEREIKSRNLFLHIENMRFLARGGRLIVTKEEWHNKSLGRGALELIQVDERGEEVPLSSQNPWYTGYTTKSLIEALYPWASISIDEDFYRENFEDSFYDVYGDLYIQQNDIYPYKVVACELSVFRLELKLNELGRAFLTVAGYLDS